MGCTGTVEIDNHVILRGDYSGPAAAQAVLREPTVEHAVLKNATKLLFNIYIAISKLLNGMVMGNNTTPFLRRLILID